MAAPVISSDTTIGLTVLLSIVSAVGVVFSISMSLKKDNREEESRRIDMAEQFAKINVKLDQVFMTLSETSHKTDRTMDELKDVNIAVARCHERIETLFKYHDDHEKRLTDLEVESK
jgi:hypothetical protein